MGFYFSDAPIVTLSVSLALGFPLAIIYRIVFIKKGYGNIFYRNLYTFIFGFLMSFYFNGKDIYHSMVTILGTYLIIKLLKNPKHIAIACWIFNFGYLLISYYMYSSDDYDINWLTPQSVLSLRLIGIGMDYYDGCKKMEEKKKKELEMEKKNSNSTTTTTTTPPSEKSKQHAIGSSYSNDIVPESEWPIYTKPELLEMLGYCYFYGTCLVGPLFTFQRYKRFIDLTLFKNKDKDLVDNKNEFLNSSFKKSIQHSLLAVLYIAIYLIINPRYDSSYLLTKEFAALSFPKRFFKFWMTGKFVLYKYFGIWMVCEAQCMITMIGYNGNDPKTGKYLWNGVKNMDVLKYEFPQSFDDLVASYNINTNLWGKHYVYKRFKFLGDRRLSLFINLTFLAFWHGFHIGYFISFYYEFSLIIIQELFRYWFKPLNTYMKENLETNITRKFKLQYGFYSFICAFMVMTSIQYPLVCFDLLKWSKIKIALSHVNWYGNTVLVVIFTTHFVLLKLKKISTKNQKLKSK